MIGIIAGYTLLTTLLFLPILPAFTSAILVGSASGVQDGWQNVWNMWWMHRALAHGQNPFQTTMLFYPTGVDLFWQTLNAPHGLLALPITALATPMAAYNAIAFVSFVAGGSTMYLLAWRLTGARLGAWMAGCLFTFAPIHMTKLVDGQLELLCMQYIPLFILSLYDAFEHARWRSSILGGILLVVMLLTSLYYGLFSLIYLGVYASAILVWKRDPATLRRIVAHTASVCLPAAIVLLPQLLGASSGAALEDWQQRQALHAATPLDMILPSPYSILWGSAVADIQSALHPGVGGAVITSGVVTLLLAALGVLLCGTSARRWAVIAGILLIFALGPYLVLDGRVTAIPLPFLLLDQLPAVKLGQRPNQIAVFSAALLALLAAYGWAAVTRRLPRAWRWGALMIALVCMAVDLWPVGLRANQLEVSPFYATIPSSSHGAILELPYQPDSSAYMTAQLIHRCPILGGYVARTPDYAFASEVDGIRQLWQPQQARDSILYADWTQALTPTLATYDIEYVVVHLDATPHLPQAAQAALAMHLTEVYRDSTLLAFQRPANAQPQPLLRLHGAGWYAVEQRDGQRWQWTGRQADLLLTNPTNRPQTAILQLRGSAFQSDREVALYRVERAGQQRIAALHIPPLPAARDYQIALTIAPGTTQLRLVTANTAIDDSGRPLGIVVTRLNLVLPEAP